MSTVIAAQEVLAGGFNVGSLGAPLGMIAAGGAALGSMAKGYTRVDEGEMGVRLRFGRAYNRHGELHGILGPGQYFSIPFTHGIKTINVRDRSTPLLSDMLVDTSDDKQLVVNAFAIWSVDKTGDNPYKAMFNIEGGEKGRTELVGQLCTAGLFKAFNDRTREAIKTDDKIQDDVLSFCSSRLLDNYGIDLKNVYVKSAAVSPYEKLGQKMVEAAMLQPFGDSFAETAGLLGTAFAAGHETSAENGHHLSIVPRLDD